MALNTVGSVSLKRTHEILSGVFDIPIATGTVSSMVKRCADGLSGTVSKIKEKMIGSALGHFDETGTRADKKLWWIHGASNCEYTYLDISHANRSAWAYSKKENFRRKYHILLSFGSFHAYLYCFMPSPAISSFLKASTSFCE